jgi:2-oxoglutarate ferredoxin oxidoreductase subunit delta
MAVFEVKINRERCKGCHLCVHFCENDVLIAEETVNEHGYFSVKADKQKECKGCSFCYLICPDMAVEIYKKEKDT